MVVADDPGMHSSQNEQDSRHYARAAKLPMFEPADSQECLDMAKAAFAMSEQFDTPVMIRLTTRISHTRGPVTLGDPEPQVVRPYEKKIEKHVMMPAMARKRHQVVEERMQQMAEASEAIGHHQIENRSGKIGFVTSGVVSQYVREAFPDASIFKLGLVWPLPMEALRRFAKSVEKLIIAEELDPVIETELKAAGINCEGKKLFTSLGEYSVPLLRQGLKINLPKPEAFAADLLPEPPARPPVLCAGCPHRGLFLALKRLNVIVTGDIGCYTLGALSPTHAMDTCVCMGASIGMAHGMAKATDGRLASQTVAVIGDSTFLHSGMTGLLNSVYNQSDSTIIILDNSITGMTGHQQNPSTGLDIHLRQAPAVDLEALCHVLGVRSVRVVDPADTRASEQVIGEEIKQPGVSVIIARRPCALIPQGRGTKELLAVLDQSLCTRCGACIRIMCPALTKGPDGYPVIDPNTCNGCGLCVRVCRFQALKQGGVQHD